MTTEATNMETKATPEITRAAERYLEQYGDPLVMNTYLKVTILVLASVCISLAALTFKSQQALANMHPLIVRINDVGHAERFVSCPDELLHPARPERFGPLTDGADVTASRPSCTG